MLPEVYRSRSITTSVPKNCSSCSSDLDRPNDEICRVNVSVDISASESQSTTAMFERECCASSHQPQPPPPSDVEVDDENDEGASLSCSSSNDGIKWTNIGGALLTLTGYRQCSSEAIRYLIEEERLHPDDPVVVGLREHLRRREQFLGLTTVLDDLFAAAASFDDDLGDYSDDDDDDQELMDSDDSLMEDVDRVEPNVMVTDKWVIRTSGCHSTNRIEQFLPATTSMDDHQRPPDSPTPSI